ncbi:MAG: hypothetical protein HYV09_24435 [Deltaproteobacteria bacterium]|nr:hypothetical protein [Deltaproteobacteria bacterium]
MAKHRLFLACLVVAMVACNKTPSAESEEGKKSDKSDKTEKSAKSDESDESDGDEGGKGKKKKKAKKSADDDEEPAKPTTPPVCRVDAQKTWAKGVNLLAGLTATSMSDGRTAVGYALGNTPQVLVIGTKGEGKLLKVQIDPQSTFASKAPKAGDGVRTIWRVTPVKLEDKVAHAFVDFHDEYKEQNAKHKRVVCGPVDGGGQWVVDQGTAYWLDPKLAKDPVAALAAEAKAAGVVIDPVKPYREIRGCRSFFDPKRDEKWIVGSRLEIVLDGDKLTKVASQLFVESGVNGKLKELDVRVQKIEPKKLDWKPVDFEVPLSHELADGSFLVAARYGSSMLVAQLQNDKNTKTKKTYPGYFNMPDASEDGPDDVLVASMSTGNNGSVLRAMRIDGTKPELPAEWSKVTTDEDDSHAESRPEFLRDSKGQRWIAYIENADKGKGHLEIIPVNAGFRASGLPYGVTKEDEKATEARLVAQKDGGFVVAYIRDSGSGIGELVTEDLDCSVVAK